MKIRMRTTAAGPHFCRNAGWVYVVSREEGEALVAAGAAERLLDAADFGDPDAPVPKLTPPETAALDAADENAAERTGRTRRRRE